MKLLLLLACLAMVPAKGIPERMGPPYREIASIEVVFTTTGGYKDDGTGLEIQFKNANKEIMASKSGEFGKFEKNMTNAVDLLVQGSYSDKDLTNSTLNLHVIPNKSDNWNFDVDITVIWNNGNTSLVHSSGYSLAQNGNDIEVSAF